MTSNKISGSVIKVKIVQSCLDQNVGRVANLKIHRETFDHDELDFFPFVFAPQIAERKFPVMIC